MSADAKLSCSVDLDPTRYTDREVVFHGQFTLGASPEIYPAGRYVIETGDRTYEGTTHTAHVRDSTVLIIPTSSGMRTVQVSEADVLAALATDAERHRGSPNENPDRGQAGASDV
jgi:hypothetical protein